jgi:hypothetical protein
MDSNQPSATSKSVTVRDNLANCPVAQRMYDRMADGVPLAAVMAVALTNHEVTTIAQSVRSLETSVRKFAKDYDERTLAALVLTHLTLVEDMANVARPMKPEALAMLAKKVTKMLIEEDVTVNLADLQIIANRLINGDAGNIYGGLNSQIVMKAFSDYICEKAGEFAAWREEQSREHSFGSFGSARSKEFARMKDQQAMKMYLDGTLNKDIK